MQHGVLEMVDEISAHTGTFSNLIIDHETTHDYSTFVSSFKFLLQLIPLPDILLYLLKNKQLFFAGLCNLIEPGYVSPSQTNQVLNQSSV